MKLTTFLARVVHGPMPKLKQDAWGSSIWMVTFQETCLSKPFGVGSCVVLSFQLGLNPKTLSFRRVALMHF